MASLIDLLIFIAEIAILLVFANLLFKLNHKFWIWRKEKKVQKVDDSKRGPQL